MGKFDKRTAIVTGGARGIGGGTARKLAEGGAHVIIIYIDESSAIKNVNNIKSSGGTADYIIGDVSEENTIKEMIEFTLQKTGRLDMLVQNAYGGGAHSFGSAVEISSEAWDRGLSLLAKSLYLGAKYAVPVMEESGSISKEDIEWSGAGLRHGEPPKQNVGRIINISSVHGLLQAPRALIYEAGKSAVIGITRQMAIDFGPLGITVNAIAPGHVVTESGEAMWREQGNEAGFKLFELQYPVRRTGVPADIANAISFLCSDEASFITGVVLPVDGGLSIQLPEEAIMYVKDFIVDNPNLRTHFDDRIGS